MDKAVVFFLSVDTVLYLFLDIWQSISLLEHIITFVCMYIYVFNVDKNLSSSRHKQCDI